MSPELRSEVLLPGPIPRYEIPGWRDRFGSAQHIGHSGQPAVVPITDNALRFASLREGRPSDLFARARSGRRVAANVCSALRRRPLSSGRSARPV